MYRSIKHTADEAYEILFEDPEELFKDLVDIIRNTAEYRSLNRKVEKVYRLSKNIEDDVFDITNDLIYMVEKGWIPKEVSVEGNELVVMFEKSKVEKFDFKALTYHMLNIDEVDGKKRIRVVFDV
jgi:SHS2 domain-containing protein